MAEFVALFNQRDIPEVGVREIARNLNISSGNLSYHFPKKASLVVAVFDQYDQVNDQLFQEYFQTEQNLKNLMELMEAILKNQYEYRGLLRSDEVVRQAFEDTGRSFDAYMQSLKAQVLRIFQALQVNKQLIADANDLYYLISFTTLLLQGWLAQARYLFAHHDVREVQDHFLRLFEYQLNQAISEMGKIYLKHFWNERKD